MQICVTHTRDRPLTGTGIEGGGVCPRLWRMKVWNEVNVDWDDHECTVLFIYLF